MGDDLSFRVGLPAQQKRALKSIITALGMALLLQPHLLAFGLSWILLTLFGILITWRTFLILVGIVRRAYIEPPLHPLLVAEDLPVYSLLIAARHEAALMDQLAYSLSHLEWPLTHLDIQILIETDDDETLRAAQRARFPYGTRLTRVPPGGPRTKPNALNVGLAHAKGMYLAVYDVEDFPHPRQLQDAYAAFQNAAPRTVCLQAPLVADNSDQAWISAQWALEYRVQFSLLLPGLSLYRMPILIGGTSNHFKKDALLAIGGWDAWNVTEDADLGMRLSRAGLTVETIRTPTLEDAPATFGIWLQQRTRWIKGFMQTWLVLMRTPLKTARQMGTIPFCVMQLTLGGSILTPVMCAPSLLLVGLALSSGHLELGEYGAGVFGAGLLIGFLGDVAAPGRWTRHRVFAMVTRPLYWPLHSIAAYRAIWELAKRPFFWAKTPHQPRAPEQRPSYSTGSSASSSRPAS